jgi:hypothetical protein
LLATSETFTLGDVRCRAPASGWSEVEETRSYALVLTRHGCFYRRADGVDVFVDSATAYISRPGTEQRIAHPADTGDRCTVVRFDQGVGEALQADVFVVDPHTDVEHRRLLAHARQGLDTFELDDRSWILVEALEARAQHLHGPRDDLASRYSVVGRSTGSARLWRRAWHRRSQPSQPTWECRLSISAEPSGLTPVLR